MIIISLVNIHHLIDTKLKRWKKIFFPSWELLDLPGGSVVKNLPANAGDSGDTGSIPVLRRSRRRERLPTPVFLPGRSHGQRNLAGYSPWGLEELATTGWLSKSVCMYIHTLCLLYPFTINGHFGCFHVLTMNIRVHLSFLISAFVFCGSIPSVELLDCTVVLFLIFPPHFSL